MSETISGLPSVAGYARLDESELAEVSGGTALHFNAFDPAGPGYPPFGCPVKPLP